MGIKNYTYCILFFYIFLFGNSRCFRAKNNVISTQSFFYNQSSDDNYNIAFLLPFCLEKKDIIFSENIDSIVSLQKDLDQHVFYKKTQISLDFFFGFLLSLNELQKNNITVSLFDIKEGDVSKDIMRRIIKEKNLKNMDLIVGPLFTNNFIFFSREFNLNIPIIAPFSKKEYITDYNENVFQLASDINTHLAALSNYIFKNHLNDNILLIGRDTIFHQNTHLNIISSEDSLIIDTIVPLDILYSESILYHIDSLIKPITNIKVSSNVIDSIHHELDTLGSRNVIVIASEDNVFVTDLLSKLHACRDTTMIVYGLPTMLDFTHISIYDLMDMEVTFPHNSIFNELDFSNFLIDFYTRFNYLPNMKHASIGYSVGVYFLDILFQHGNIFQNIDNYNSRTILGTTYSFEKNKHHGYKNRASSIWKYDNFGYRNMD